MTDRRGPGPEQHALAKITDGRRGIDWDALTSKAFRRRLPISMTCPLHGPFVVRDQRSLDRFRKDHGAC